jgi:16S rRNA (guanine966-N2)-methyltransferase
MKRSKPSPSDRSPAGRETVGLRIVGGKLRGRALAYSGDERTRPMKDRVRESVFNLLGPAVAGTHAIDLFAGTGALGLEAISRGAVRATLLERHLPTCHLIENNADQLGIREQIDVQFADTFKWNKLDQLPADRPWVVFCSPPFEFYDSRLAEMLQLIERFHAAAPAGSLFAVESDERFDFGLLPAAAEWDVRTYLPAIVGVLVK